MYFHLGRPTHTSAPARVAPTDLGAACVVPPSITSPKLRCDTEDLAAMAVAVGQVVTPADAREAIKAASQLAVKWLLSAAASLMRPRPKGAAGEIMRLKFREAFGTSPEFVPPWRPQGETWDRGDIVRARLLCVAKIVANGSIEYICWGPRSCPFTLEADWRASTWAIVQRGRYRICLGQRFWTAWKDGHKNDLAATLFHEGLHIYFPTVTHRQERGTYGQAECYERFVLLINRVPLPDYVKRTCPSSIPTGDFPPPPRDRAFAHQPETSADFLAGAFRAHIDADGKHRAMHITSRLAEPQSACNFQPPFSSAERNITEKDAPHIFTILGGPSPWQRYLQQNLAAHKKDLPRQPMRIVTEGDFAKSYRAVFGQPPPADAQGFVDRRNATIYLREFPARNFNQTKAGLALHEAVHLFSHPPGRSNSLRASVYALLEGGLLEGLTQVVTEDIQAAQCIRPLRASWQPYKEYTPVARRFLQAFTPALVADAYFNGTVTPLINAITTRWTIDGFRRVRRLANAKKTQQALQTIENLEQAFRLKPRIIQFQQVFRGAR